jgi:hypothetical protein
LRAERILRDSDLTGLTTLQIRSLAELAYQDKDEAHRFAMDIYRQRLMASEGRG